MKKLFFFVSILILLIGFMTYDGKGKEKAEALNQGKKYKDVSSTLQLRAISLHVLNERLRASKPNQAFPDKLLNLAGITRVYGFVVDEKNHDIILYGDVNTSLPSLHLEDFIIALRNAYMKYAELEGNTYYYSHPGCSIDPYPKILKKLDDVGNLILSSSSPSDVERGIEEWHEICRSPQEVKVLGIPFNTHFAKVMVKADYDMKLIVDGADDLGISGLKSLSDITLDKVKESIVQEKPITIPMSGMDRFWFFPGENIYEEDVSIISLKKCPVILLTEEQYISEKEGIYGTGQMNPQAKIFTDLFTRYYSDVAIKRPIYTELESLFRFVALAKIIKYKYPEEKNLINLVYLLNQFPIRETFVDKKLPGRSNVKHFKHRKDIQGGYQEAQLWLPSCGGVGIDIAINKNNFIKNTSGGLAALKESILGLRTSQNSLYWDIYPDLYRKALYLAKTNIDINHYLYTSKDTRGILTFQRHGNELYVLVKNKNGPELWIVNKGKIIRRLKDEEAIEGIDSVTRKMVVAGSQGSVQFLHAGSYNPQNLKKKIIIQLGKQKIEVSHLEIQRLFSGDSDLPGFDMLFKDLSGKERHKVIVYRDAFSRGEGSEKGDYDNYYYENYRHINPLKFLLALNRCYKDKCDFYLDDEMELAHANINKMPIVKSGKDIAAYITEKGTFKIEDWNVVKQIQSYLNEADITTVKTVQPVEHPNILIITGHKDQELRGYLEMLIKNGSLKGKYVVLFTCYQSGDEGFNSRIIKEGGAHAALFYSEVIDPQAVQDVLVQLTKILKGKGFKPTKMEDLIDQSVNRALEESDLESLRIEIEKMRHGVIQISGFGKFFIDKKVAGFKGIQINRTQFLGGSHV